MLTVYVPFEQHYSDNMILYARSRGKPADISLAVEHEIRAAGPQVLVNVTTGPEMIGRRIVPGKDGRRSADRLRPAGIGTRRSIGLYGILAYSVTQRRRCEFGLRMALGAESGQVRAGKMILKQGMSARTNRRRDRVRGITPGRADAEQEGGGDALRSKFEAIR